jgi:hypothetical protein
VFGEVEVVRDCTHNIQSVHASTGKGLPCRCMYRLNVMSAFPAPQGRGTLPASSHLHVHQTRNHHLPFDISTSVTALPSLILISHAHPGTFASMPCGFAASMSKHHHYSCLHAMSATCGTPHQPPRTPPPLAARTQCYRAQDTTALHQ